MVLYTMVKTNTSISNTPMWYDSFKLFIKQVRKDV